MNYKLRQPVPFIKQDSEIALLEKACRIVAETFLSVEKYMKPGVSTLEIDKIAEDYIKSKNAKPAFKGYKVDGLIFPNTLCISINDEIVHGIPSERKLKNGDIVSVDCGAEIFGYYGDSAVTYPIGEIGENEKKLLKVTEQALFFGIEQAVENNKLYDISRAVQEYAEKNGYSVTRELVGHGIGKRLHEEPPIPNFVPPLLHRKKYPNITLKRNMALAIEPMVHMGRQYTKTQSNGWTFVTADGSPAAHFEHTIIVDKDKPKILTLRD
jgi:methionyl aminopeptidase